MQTKPILFCPFNALDMLINVDLWCEGEGHEMARGGNPTVVFDSNRQQVVYSVHIYMHIYMSCIFWPLKKVQGQCVCFRLCYISTEAPRIPTGTATSIVFLPLTASRFSIFFDNFQFFHFFFDNFQVFQYFSSLLTTWQNLSRSSRQTLGRLGAQCRTYHPSSNSRTESSTPPPKCWLSRYRGLLPGPGTGAYIPDKDRFNQLNKVSSILTFW